MKFFDQADANKDGRLNGAEFVTMIGLFHDSLKEHFGEWTTWSEDEIAIGYTAYNTLSADDGVTKDDMKAIRPILRASMASLAAQ